MLSVTCNNSLLRGANKFCDCVPELDQKRGHHKIERYLDNSTDHKKVLDDGEEILDEEQFERKKSSVHSALEKAYGTKGALTRDEIADLINEAQEGDDDGDKTEDESASSGAEEAAVQQKSEVQSAGSGIFGFSKFLAASNAASSGSAAGKGNSSTRKHGNGPTPKSTVSRKGTGAGTKPKPTAQIRVLKPAMKGSSSKKARASGTQEVRHMDGRIERLHSNVKEDGDNIKNTLTDLKDKFAVVSDDKEGQGKEFQEAIKNLISITKELGTDIKNAMARITRSKVDHDMNDQMDELKALSV